MPKRVILTAQEIEHLKQLAAAGLHGRTINGPVSEHGLERLVKARYVVDQTVSLDAVVYMITALGRRTLAEHLLP